MYFYEKIDWQMPEIKHLHGTEAKRAQVADEVLQWALASSYHKKYSGVYPNKQAANTPNATPKFRIFAIDMDDGAIKHGFFSNEQGYIDAAGTKCPVVLVVRTNTNQNAKPSVQLPLNKVQYDYYIYLLPANTTEASPALTAGNRPSISSLDLIGKHLPNAMQPNAQQALIDLMKQPPIHTAHP